MTREEIMTLDLDQLESRSAELAEEAKEADMIRLDEINTEFDAIDERRAQIQKANETRARAAKAVAEGAGEPVAPKPVEERKIEMFGVETREYRDAWVKSIINRELTVEERAALTSAGAVIPTMTVNDVWDKLVKPADLLGKVDISQFPSYVRFPKATTVNAATAQAVGGTITESSDVVGYVDLIPNEYVKLLTVGADIDHMAIDAIHTWIVNNITDSIRYAINKDIVVGTGTNALKGLTASVTADATAIPATVTKASILKIMAALGANYQAGAVWIMTPAMFYENILPLTSLNDYIINDGFQFKLFGHD